MKKFILKNKKIKISFLKTKKKFKINIKKNNIFLLIHIK